MLKLPNDYVPANVEVRNARSCSGSYHYECMAFPDISYYIIYTFSNNNLVLMDTYLPKATSQVNYNVPALVWQSNRYRGIDYLTMTSNCRYDYLGTFVGYNGMSTVGLSNSQQPNKIKYQIQVDFQLRHAVPVGGTIQIVFPSSVTAAYPHCRSMTNEGSSLSAKVQSNNG